MMIAEKKPLYFFYGKVFFHCLFYGRQRLLMNYFVRLKIKGPIVFVRNGLKRFIRLYRKHTPSFSEGIIPYGFNDFNF